MSDLYVQLIPFCVMYSEIIVFHTNLTFVVRALSDMPSLLILVENIKDIIENVSQIRRYKQLHIDAFIIWQ